MVYLLPEKYRTVRGLTVGSAYMLTNKLNGKKYIGKTQRDLKYRISEHFKPGKSPCRVLNKAINKYGKSNFDINILYVSNDLNELNKKEVEYIQNLNTIVPNGYNLSLGGEGMSPSIETRRLLSAQRKGISLQHTKKPICAIHTETKTIITFDSILSAEKQGFKRRQINTAMRNCHGINAYKNYYWVFLKNIESFVIPNIPQEKRQGVVFESKPVIVFDTKTLKMVYFKSINSCIKVYGNKKYVCQCLSGKRSIYKDCIFSWKSGEVGYSTRAYRG